jgi:hypothetical protein
VTQWTVFPTFFIDDYAHFVTRIRQQTPLCYDKCTRKQWDEALESARLIVGSAVDLFNHIARRTDPQHTPIASIGVA